MSARAPHEEPAPASARAGSVRYGTSSWSESSWVGPFYPAGTKAADFLTYYATQFSVVEADTTYYRVPSSAMVRGWRAKTPSGFRLAAKFPRSIVHGGRGEKPDGGVVLVEEHVRADTDRFLDALRELGDRAGPLVLQFPYFNRTAFASLAPFLERLDAYLAKLPDDFRYGVEIRNKNWLVPALFDVLRARRVAFVAVDLPYVPHPLDLPAALDLVTTDFTYVRLIGDRHDVEARTETFDRIVVDHGARLDRWAEWIARVQPRVRETFAFANNHFAGHGPATIRELARKVETARGEGAESPRPAG